MVNINKLMKQAEKMQADMARKMEEMEIEGSAGGGAVKIRMNGKKEVLAVSIDREAVDTEDLSILEDLVLAAVNDAGKNVDEELSTSLGGQMPPGFPMG